MALNTMTMMSDGGGGGSSYNIDPEAILNAVTRLTTDKEELQKNMADMNAAFEATKSSLVTKQATDIRTKYEEAAASQQEVINMIDAQIVFLETSLNNYLKASGEA